MKKEMPLEIEKKFLIKMPDIEWIKANTHCEIAQISQTYLGLRRNGFGDRVRKMTVNKKARYFHTAKKSISDMTRIEIEKEITKEEYNHFLSKKHKGKKLAKTRYIIFMNNLKYEIDIYPFWKETAILEIELKSEDEEFVIPDFIKILGDVTGNREYSNSSLAKKFKDEGE